MKQLILVGAGHCHLLSLLALTRDHRFNTQFAITLISNTDHSLYSGRLPGWIAGHYSIDALRIDVRNLCQRLNVRYINASVTQFDLTDNRLQTGEQSLPFDVLSLNVGSRTATAVDPEYAIKPLDAFQRHINSRPPPSSLAILGSGAAALEIAFACRARFPDARMALMTCRGVLTNSPKPFRTMLMNELKQQTIDVIEHPNPPVDEFEQVYRVTGPQAHPWQAYSGLMTNDAGYILIEPSLHSVSHDTVFAVGDCSSMRDIDYDKSGIHAVRQAPVLAHNLTQRLFDSGNLTAYRPQTRTLYLLASNHKTAFGVYGNITFHGRWVWYWKHWLDTRFLTQFKLKQRSQHR